MCDKQCGLIEWRPDEGRPRAGVRLGHRHPRGFALVITLSLMVLLTLLAVGLLGLSAISLRQSANGESRAIAMANARMGLMLALGQLQRELGDDRRKPRRLLRELSHTRRGGRQRGRAGLVSR